ncbi:MAG: tetratricopeptide repeat protein [Acidobacteria bacterium]|nr:tetratricopeptide repeat protein [Acidobacteriota bacterium]
MTLPFPRHATIASLWLAAAMAFAQEHGVAERLYLSGDRAYAARSFAEALESWNQVLQQEPRSPYAARALYRIARHHADEGRPQQALPLIEKLKSEHLSSPWAGEGMLLRGSLLAQAARRPQDLREAMGEYHRVLDLFPDLPSAPEAHARLGQAWKDQGSWGRALHHFLEASRLDPRSLVGLQATLQAAELLDLTGDLQGCLRMLQRVRDLGPGTALAEEAGWRLAVRIRHRLLRGPLRSEGPWPGGRTKWLKTPTLLATGPKGELFIYQDDLDRAAELRGDQLVPVGPTGRNAKAMVAGPAGSPWLVLSKQPVLRDEGVLGTAGPAAPGGAFMDRWGTLWLSDAKNPSLLLVAPDGSSRSIPSPTAVALAPLPGGAAVLASDSNRSLHFINAQGQPQLTVPYGKDLSGPFRSVLSLCSDPLGHIAAIVDGGDFEGVVLWGPDGQVLRSATWKSLGISGKFRAIALDRAGGILLADRSNDLLVRLI